MTVFGLGDMIRVTRFGPSDSFSGPSITSFSDVLADFKLKDGSNLNLNLILVNCEQYYTSYQKLLDLDWVPLNLACF